MVHRFAMFPEPKNVLLRAFRYSLVQWGQYVRAIREDGVSAISSGSTPPTAGILCAKVKKRLSKRYGHKVPFIFILQDVFPDSLVSTGLCRENSLLYKIGNMVADYTYRNADKIIVISEDFRQMLLGKGIPEEKIKLIYNWVDETAVVSVPRNENPLFDKYNLDRSKFYVAYSGNIGLTQNMDMLLTIAEELTSRQDIGFILVGDGAYREQVERIVAGKQLSNVKTIPFQPYEDISYVFSLGDVGLLISKRGVASNSVPSKTWSYMSAERPILASFDSNSELCRIIEEHDCGVCVEADDKEGLKEAILRLFSADRSRYGENGRRFVVEHISKTAATQQYVDLMNNLSTVGVPEL